MSLLIAGSLALVGYLWLAGKLSPSLLKRIGGIALGLIAGKFALGGQWLPALALGAAAIWFAGAPRLSPGRAAEDRARALLGVPPGADAETIRAAHRRLAASAHPDRGGSDAAMQELNAARDLLLRRVRQPPR